MKKAKKASRKARQQDGEFVVVLHSGTRLETSRRGRRAVKLSDLLKPDRFPDRYTASDFVALFGQADRSAPKRTRRTRVRAT